ncbi:hypothetical protein [Sphaerisporangium sp. TRM90804]|uniref:hypothetical protein n=1 Tax=Sphaerisporangium sp. TRM90804 TaxID=3031113 RepID=UPI002448DEF9|nr:hypothetical protein [Sphaerisporangium sp. TRM90804]MDH2425746.1 hypothetical protein [Sphaerisporangium sp. TRM90804]
MPEPLEPEPLARPRRSKRRRPGPICDDCHRRVWASDSLRAGPDGRRRGDKCRRKANRRWRRLRLRMGRIRRMRPGPNQLSILDPNPTDQESP